MVSDWLLIGINLEAQISKLKELCEDPKSSFGYIYDDMQTVLHLLNKVIDYFASKIDSRLSPRLSKNN